MLTAPAPFVGGSSVFGAAGGGGGGGLTAGNSPSVGGIGGSHAIIHARQWRGRGRDERQCRTRNGYCRRQPLWRWRGSRWRGEHWRDGRHGRTWGKAGGRWRRRWGRHHRRRRRRRWRRWRGLLVVLLKNLRYRGFQAQQRPETMDGCDGIAPVPGDWNATVSHSMVGKIPVSARPRVCS